jgi:Ras-related protein Rab-8A
MKSNSNTASGSALPATLVKLIIIGDSNVGKSCLLQRFCDDEFTPSFIATIGIDHRSKVISLPVGSGSGNKGKPVKVQVWDTAGQEQYKAMTSNFYRSAMGVAVVYDVTYRRSFMNIPNWLKNVEEHGSDGMCKFLVGNKCDMQNDRAVSWEEGQELAERYGMIFMETSAKANINVDEVFTGLAKACISQKEQASVTGNEACSGDKSLPVNLLNNASQVLGSRVNSCCR